MRQLKDREKKAIRAKKAARELELLQMEQLREEFELERREYERQIDGLRKRARDTGDRLAQLRATYDRDTKQLAAKADATLVRKETAMKKLKEKAHGEVQTLQGAMREQVEALQAELKRQAAAHDAEKAELVRRHQGVQAAAREEHRAELQALKDKHVGNLKEVMVSEEAWKVRSEELAAAAQQACARIGDLEEEAGKKAEIVAALESSLADLAGEREVEAGAFAKDKEHLERQLRNAKKTAMRDAEREREELAKEVDRKAQDVAYLEEKLRAQQAAHIEEFAALRRRKEAELEEAVAEQKRKTEEKAALADRGERQLAEAAAAHKQQVGKLTKALLQYKAACKLQREELARIHSAQAAKAMIDLKLGEKLGNPEAPGAE